MSLKSINESFERQFNVINDSKNEEFEVLESLRNLLSTLNEADMSDEDRRESDLIRSAYNKIQKRVNARLTPQEQAVLDKYGIERNYKNLDMDSSVAGRKASYLSNTKIVNNPEDQYSHGRDASGEYRRLKNGSYGYTNSTKNPSKINYADRARKRPERLKNRTFDYTEFDNGWAGSRSYDTVSVVDYNRHDDKSLNKQPGWRQGRGVSQNDAISNQSQSNLNKMKSAINDRNDAQKKLDSAKDKYDREKVKRDAEYMKAMKKAEDDYDLYMRLAKQDYDTNSNPSRRDKAQDEIDTLLRRKKTEAVDLSDKKGSMTKVLSDNDSWKNETTVKGIADKVKSILDKKGIDTPASKRLIANIAKNKNYVKALETVYNSILAGANLSTKRGTSKSKKEESLKEAWSVDDLYSDVYGALSDVMFKWSQAGYDLDPSQVDSAYEWFVTHFWED